jgi:hypothetical protein
MSPSKNESLSIYSTWVIVVSQVFFPKECLPRALLVD